MSKLDSRVLFNISSKLPEFSLKRLKTGSLSSLTDCASLGSGPTEYANLKLINKFLVAHCQVSCRAYLYFSNTYKKFDEICLFVAHLDRTIYWYWQLDLVAMNVQPNFGVNMRRSMMTRQLELVVVAMKVHSNFGVNMRRSTMIRLELKKIF